MASLRQGYVFISFFLPSRSEQGYEQRRFTQQTGGGGQGSLRQVIMYAYKNKRGKTRFK